MEGEQEVSNYLKNYLGYEEFQNLAGKMMMGVPNDNQNESLEDSQNSSNEENTQESPHDCQKA